MRSAREPARDDRPFAVVDVGSNSARMIVFRLRNGQHLDVIEDARAPLRLARELHDDDDLGTEAIERTLEALRDFRAVADGAGARSMLAIATSAVREARDGDVLIARARDLGVPLEMIDGEVEARLGFVGAVHDLPVEDGATMDVGGGTTELTRFRDRSPERSWTLPLGSLRLTDRFLATDPPARRELEALAAEVRTAFVRADPPGLPKRGTLIGIGGTVRNLAKIDLRRTGHPLRILHGYELPADRLRAIVDELAGRTAKRRAKVRGLNPDRIDSIVAGGVIVATAMDHLGAEGLVVSSRGLREGIALGGPDVEVPEPAWVRRISVHTLAARFATWDARAASRRERLAGGLHEVLDPNASATIRELLSHAATLVDVGRAIDYYDRFHHAATVVTAADVAGFSHEALATLTAILRQADDDDSLGPLARLVPTEARAAVLRAATVLALAEELHRRIPTRRTVPFSARWADGRFDVEVPVAAGWRPRAVARRFREVFDGPLSIVPVPIRSPTTSSLAPD